MTQRKMPLERKKSAVLRTLRNSLSAFSPLLKKGRGFFHRLYASSLHRSEASMRERSQDQSFFTVNSHCKEKRDRVTDVHLFRMEAPTNSSKATWELLVKQIISIFIVPEQVDKLQKY